MYSPTDYDFDLPQELIAQEPVKERDTSRLLFLNRKRDKISHHTFSDIKDLLQPSDVLVVNNTEVIPGRLFGYKKTGGKVEILILDYADGMRNLAENGAFECSCLVKASKRPGVGSVLQFKENLKAVIIHLLDGIFTIRFTCKEDFTSVLKKIGKIPLPPYIKRNQDAKFNDQENYQTIYASQKGAIAAPTAGLHFTDKLFEQIKSNGIKVVFITLHVGYGTFVPVRVSDIREHKMHSEWYSIPKETAEIINKAKSMGNRVVAVGTTSVRTLEYAADKVGKVLPQSGSCDLFIYPGYSFKIVDAIITNFHLPKSTLIMLISAFASHQHIFAAYKEAIQNGYRFYSYGDAMYIE